MWRSGTRPTTPGAPGSLPELALEPKLLTLSPVASCGFFPPAQAVISFRRGFYGFPSHLPSPPVLAMDSQDPRGSQAHLPPARWGEAGCGVVGGPRRSRGAVDLGESD